MIDRMAMGGDCKIHVVALPLPAQGHISPMMHLSKMLASQPGILVSFVNVDSLHQEMMKHWPNHEQQHQEGLNLRFHQIPFSWQMPTGVDASVVANVSNWFAQVEHQLAPALSNLISEIGPVRCIISDYTLPWTQHVADRFNIPRIILWSGNATWASFEYHTPKLMERGHIHPLQGGRVPLDEARSVVVDYVGGVSPITQADVPDHLLSADEPQDLRKDAMKRYHSVKRASWVLVNSFYELEKEAFDFMTGEIGPRFVAAGPMFLLDHDSGLKNVVLRSQSEDCLGWLNKQERNSVLYISFGSVAALKEEQFKEVAAAVHESKRPFLWVMRSEQEVFRDRFMSQSMKSQGLIVSWAPQLQVLQHPSVGAFLSHCGWNSTMESICNGVPLICWPYAAEQNTNSKFVVEDWGIGVRFHPGVVQELIGRAQVLSAIETVMTDKEMRLRAENLKSLGRKALDKDGEGHSFNNLTDFVNYLKS